MNIIVTGGAGFIGSNFVFHILKKYPDYRIICLDKLTYAGNLSTLAPVMDNPNFRFVKADIYGKWHGVTLSAENKKQFLIPEGFAHGFLVLSDEAEFCYKVNDFWHPNDEGGMAWNDPEIGIEWPELKGEYKGSASAEGYTLEDGTVLNLSDKDQKWLGLKDTFKF